jgi:uncharacterized protein YjbI with pentapeptide repeats
VKKILSGKMRLKKIRLTIYAALLAIAFLGAGVLLLGPVARWLASVEGFRGLSGAQRLGAVNNARGSLLQFLAGAAAFGALLYTARNYLISRQTYDLAERGQITDRFTKAVEQLSSNAIEIRIGGIYALERIARDSALDHQMVIDVLCAYVRGHATKSAPYPTDDKGNVVVPGDLQMVMQVLGRRNAANDEMPLDLRGVRLTGVELYDADLSDCFMPNADLSRCSFHRVSLKNSRLMYSDFDNAHLVDVDFANSLLIKTSFKEACLYSVNFSGSDLSNYSSFSSAELHKVSLSAANLESADLSDAKFCEMDLSGIDFGTTDLSGANLTEAVGLSFGSLRDACWTETTRLPDLDITDDPLVRDLSAALGRQLGGSAADWAGRMCLEVYGPNEIDLVVDHDDSSTSFEVNDFLPAEAKLALLELNIASPDVSGRRLKWDAVTQAWIC